MKAVLIGTLLLMSQLAFAGTSADELSCSNGQGFRLCTAFSKLESYFQIYCKGSACDQTWRTQLLATREMQKIIMQTNFGKGVDSVVANQARSLASVICGKEYFYPPRYAADMATFRNERMNLLGQLVSIQGLGGIDVPVTCVLQQNSVAQ